MPCPLVSPRKLSGSRLDQLQLFFHPACRSIPPLFRFRMSSLIGGIHHVPRADRLVVFESDPRASLGGPVDDLVDGTVSRRTIFRSCGSCAAFLRRWIIPVDPVDQSFYVDPPFPSNHFRSESDMSTSARQQGGGSRALCPSETFATQTRAQKS